MRRRLLFCLREEKRTGRGKALNREGGGRRKSGQEATRTEMLLQLGLRQETAATNKLGQRSSQRECWERAAAGGDGGICVVQPRPVW